MVAGGGVGTAAPTLRGVPWPGHGIHATPEAAVAAGPPAPPGSIGSRRMGAPGMR